jgi:hypothetical protein
LYILLLVHIISRSKIMSNCVHWSLVYSGPNSTPEQY